MALVVLVEELQEAEGTSVIEGEGAFGEVREVVVSVLAEVEEEVEIRILLDLVVEGVDHDLTYW